MEDPIMPLDCEVFSEMNINNLPNEILYYLFNFFPLETLLNCDKVCDDWRKISRDPRLWRKFTITYSCKSGQTDAEEKNLNVLLTFCDCISSIKLQYIFDYPFILSLVNKCENLVSLELTMCKLQKEFCDDVKAWPKLKKLNLKNTIVMNCNKELILIDVNNFKDLTYLALSDFGLSTNNFDNLLQCAHLTHINIDKIRNLHVDGIRKLISNKQKILVSFHIHGGNAVDDGCLHILADCPQLEELTIIRCENLSDAGLIAIANIKKILYLQIWNNYRFTEEGLLRTLSNKNLYKLYHLSLSRIFSISPVVVDMIAANYKDLKFLALYQCPKIFNTDYERQINSKFPNLGFIFT